MRQSQWSILYKEMKRGMKITPYSALKLCGTLCLHKRIEDVERIMGVNVIRGWQKTRYSRVRTYSL